RRRSSHAHVQRSRILLSRSWRWSPTTAWPPPGRDHTSKLSTMSPVQPVNDLAGSDPWVSKKAPSAICGWSRARARARARGRSRVTSTRTRTKDEDEHEYETIPLAVGSTRNRSSRELIRQQSLQAEVEPAAQPADEARYVLGLAGELVGEL